MYAMQTNSFSGRSSLWRLGRALEALRNLFTVGSVPKCTRPDAKEKEDIDN